MENKARKKAQARPKAKGRPKGKAAAKSRKRKQPEPEDKDDDDEEDDSMSHGDHDEGGPGDQALVPKDEAAENDEALHPDYAALSGEHDDGIPDPRPSDVEPQSSVAGAGVGQALVPEVGQAEPFEQNVLDGPFEPAAEPLAEPLADARAEDIQPAAGSHNDNPAPPDAAAAAAAQPDEQLAIARRSSERIHCSPKDVLARITPNTEHFTLYLSYNDWRFKCDCKFSDERFVAPYHKRTFSKVFSQETWQQALMTVHDYAWSKWRLCRDTHPADKPEQHRVPDEIFELLQPIISKMPPPKDYSKR